MHFVEADFYCKLMLAFSLCDLGKYIEKNNTAYSSPIHLLKYVVKSFRLFCAA
jgi:hypothetical protein